MLNPSLNAYGIGKSLAAVQSVAGGQNALVSTAGLKSLGKVEDKEPVKVDKAELDAAVKKLNEFVAPALQTIQFSVDQESERMVVKVVDTATQKVLRQIPNEEVLAISKTLDKLQGLVIRQTA
ncbi:MAG: flagellar protein FlaG [Methylophilaceae bacterium]|jgi:flagellar protein FlaG